MNNNKKLSEELLKIDNIDPANIPDSERQMFEQLLDKHLNSGQSKQVLLRIITKSTLSKLTTAAAITIALIIGLNQFGVMFSVTNVALADVATKLEQTKNCVFKKTTTVFSEDNGTNAFDSLVYYTKAAIREDIYDNEKITNQVYVDFSEGIIVGIEHKKKLFRKMDLADEDIENEKLSSSISPENIVNMMLSEGEYKKLGRETIDGVFSEGFEFDDKRALLSADKDMVENIVTRLWVNVNTNLPVRIEVDGVLINNIKANVVMFDPQWDIELEADFFEPKIPDNYITPEERGYVGINLENWPTLKIVPGAAADKAGLKDEDILLKINDNIITDSTSSTDAMDMLFGKIGDKVILTVQRDEQKLTFEVEKAALPE